LAGEAARCIHQSMKAPVPLARASAASLAQCSGATLFSSRW
jgi:hypothetical protein